MSWGLLVLHSVGGLLGFDRGVGNGVGVWSGLLRLWGACFGGGGLWGFGLFRVMVRGGAVV
ncbi:MAG: hypothetical protein QW291_09505 [Thermofilaceae archaeon]